MISYIAAAVLSAASPAAPIPSDYACEIVGPIVEYGDVTFTDPEAPVTGFVLSLVCPVPQISVSSTGRVSTDIEMMPLFVVLSEEQAEVLVDAAADLLADDTVFLP